MFYLLYVITFMVITVFLLYVSITVYTFLKVREYHLPISIGATLLIPFLLIKAHIQIYNKVKYNDKNKARKSLIFLFEKYPIALTMLLTVFTTTLIKRKQGILKDEVRYNKTNSEYPKKSKEKLSDIDKSIKKGDYSDMMLAF